VSVGAIPNVSSNHTHSLVQIDVNTDCLLWNKSCVGNRSKALLDFFGDPGSETLIIRDSLLYVWCFSARAYDIKDCTGTLLVLAASAFSDSLHAVLLYLEHIPEEARRFPWVSVVGVGSCCGQCGIGGSGIVALSSDECYGTLQVLILVSC